ncbi:MAG: serpin family protein [Verrucomicrobiales bacterium]
MPKPALTEANPQLAGRAIEDLTVSLYPKLIGDLGENNFVFSPTSIQFALAMTAAGAKGATLEEMHQVLHYGAADQAELIIDSFTQLLTALRALDGSPDRLEGGLRTTLRVVNRIFVQEAFEVSPEFQDAMAELAAFESKPFNTNPDGARQEINAWVSEQTQNKIENLLPGGSISNNTMTVLVNALYFKGSWARAFSPHSTSDKAFTLPSGEEVMTPTMTVLEGFSVLEKPGYTVVALPYRDESTRMLVIVPEESASFSEFEAELSAGWWREFDSEAEHARVILEMPRFKVESPLLGLKEPFERLGMQLPFTGGADFSGISSKDSFFIESIFHKAVVEVDEEGTEGAAATAVVMARTSVPTEPPKLLQINRPFFFVVQDTASGAVLFFGRVLDPRQDT